MPRQIILSGPLRPVRPAKPRQEHSTDLVNSVLTDHGHGLWTVQRTFRQMGLPLTSRLSVVRLSDGGLWLHSPERVDKPLIQALAQLGRVRYLVCPNRFHHLFAADYQKIWPGVRLYGAPGLVTKRPDLHFDGILARETPLAWQADLEQVWLEGMPQLNEIAFHHRASATLILTDLLANVGRDDVWALRLWMTLNRAYGQPAPTLLIRKLVRDRQRLEQSLERIMAWDFQRIVMAHGAVVEQNAAQVMAQTRRVLLET